MRKENWELRQKIVEIDSNREALSKELAQVQRDAADVQNDLEIKKKDLERLVEESREDTKVSFVKVFVKNLLFFTCVLIFYLILRIL